MSSHATVDIFAEDNAHAAFLVPMVQRIAREEEVTVTHRVRSARGGHARAITELKLYQTLVERGAAGATVPNLLIAGIDGNCTTSARKRKDIVDATSARFTDRLVVACPDPHVERWYLADPESFKTVVGRRPVVGKRKCARDHYKRLLAKALQQAGYPPTLGGIEFAAELVDGMDLYRAGKIDHSLKAFVDDLRGQLKTLKQEHQGRAR